MPPTPGGIRQYWPAVWILVFVSLLFKGSVVNPPIRSLLALLLAGLVECLIVRREVLLGVYRRHGALLATAALLGVLILLSQLLAARRGLPLSDPLPPQTLLFLSIPVVAAYLREASGMGMLAGLFWAVSAWHLVMLPIEALSGWKLTWHPIHLLPRPTWPLNFQASGLAWQTFSFVGFFLPLFYLVWGLERHAYVQTARRAWPQVLLAALPWMWLIPVVCVQSRSGFAGALAASTLAYLTSRKRTLGRRDWLLLGACVLLLAVLYSVFLTVDKSGVSWRLAYFKAYLVAGIDPQWILTGRGFSREAPPPLEVPGLGVLVHSHNDVAQIIFSWGLPTLLAYFAFWISLIHSLWKHFGVRREFWPFIALLAFIPSVVTDVGIFFFEKSAFIALIAALTISCSVRQRI